MLTFSSVATLEQLEKKKIPGSFCSASQVLDPMAMQKYPVILRELLRPSELVTNLWMTSV